MSATVRDMTDGKEINVKAEGHILNHRIAIGEYDISLEDFFMIAEYVLTNTDLQKDDPRLEFLKSVRKLGRVPGYNKGLERLSTTPSPEAK